MAFVIMVENGEAQPCWVENGEILYVKTDETSAFTLTDGVLRGNLGNLSKQQLFDLIERIDCSIAKRSDKTALVDFIISKMDNIRDRALEKERVRNGAAVPPSPRAVRVVASSTSAGGYAGSSTDQMKQVGSDEVVITQEDIDMDGMRTIAYSEKYQSPTKTTGYIIVYEQGIPHVQTAEGIYQVDEEFLASNNCFYPNKDFKEDDGSSSVATKSSEDDKTEIEKNHQKVDWALFDVKPNESGILELNAKTGEKFLDIKVSAVDGDYTLRYFYGIHDKISDVKTCLMEKFGWSKDAISLYYPSGKSYFGDWEPIDASVAKDRDFVLLCVKLLGGGKRAKKAMDEPKDEVKTPKDIKTILGENLTQLKSLPDPNGAIRAVVIEVEKIMADVKANPDTPVSSLFDAVPVAKRANILSSTMTVSPRAEDRIAFITEQVLGEKVENLDDALRMTSLAKTTLCLTIQFAIHSEFQDNKGGIGWQRMLKALADKMSAPPPNASDGRCAVM